MGSNYINPTQTSKEKWLEDNAISVNAKDYPTPPGYEFVCLVQNPGFTAAGVVRDQRDYEDFTDPKDNRARKYFWVLGSLLDDVVRQPWEGK